MGKVEKDAFSTKDEFFRFEQIAESPYFFNLIALIIAVIFCLFLFRVIWSWTRASNICKRLNCYRHLSGKRKHPRWISEVPISTHDNSIISDCRLVGSHHFLRHVCWLWGEVFQEHIIGKCVCMGRERDTPNFFPKKSSLFGLSLFNPWWLCLPIS